MLYYNNICSNNHLDIIILILQMYSLLVSIIYSFTPSRPPPPPPPPPVRRSYQEHSFAPEQEEEENSDLMREVRCGLCMIIHNLTKVQYNMKRRNPFVIDMSYIIIRYSSHVIGSDKSDHFSMILDSEIVVSLCMVLFALRKKIHNLSCTFCNTPHMCGLENVYTLALKGMSRIYGPKFRICH